MDSLEGVTEEAGSSGRMRGRPGVNDNKLANPLHLCLLRGTTLGTRQLTVLPAVTQHAPSSRLSEASEGVAVGCGHQREWRRVGSSEGVAVGWGH